VLLVSGARQGGAPTAFDPDPLLGGEHYDTRLSGDLTHVIAGAAVTVNLRGLVPLYRLHFWSCPEGLRVPSGHSCPSWASYSQGAAPRRTAVPEAAPLPHPWQGIRGTARGGDDLLSLEDAAMPRRRMMASLALSLWKVTLAGQLPPAAVQMGKRIRDPKPGDLSVEVTCAAKAGSERKGFGILLARRREWLSVEWEFARAMDDEPDDLRGNGVRAAGDLATDAWYVQYGPGERNVCRWDSAQFVAALTDERAGGLS
jgi:hypothetical protein